MKTRNNDTGLFLFIVVMVFLLLSGCSFKPECERAHYEDVLKVLKNPKPKEIPPGPKFFYGDKVRVKELSSEKLFYSKVCKFEGKITLYREAEYTGLTRMYGIKLSKPCDRYNYKNRSYDISVYESEIEVIAETAKGK
jgi:hypothetical protein